MYISCLRPVSSPADVGESINGTLEQGEQARFQLDIPEVGLTIRLSIETGHVVVYASTKIPNPNAAYYDWKLECDDVGGCDFFVDPQDLDIVRILAEDTKRTLKRQVNETSHESGSEVVYSNFTLYLVTEGIEKNTTFVIETTFGDTTTPKGIYHVV